MWESHKRSIEGLSKFSRFGGRFPLTAVGKINTYSIFAETARSICSPDGRVGIIVPSGIATDDTTNVFFADLVDRQSLVSLYDFENREGVFPGVHRSYKFCLLTLNRVQIVHHPKQNLPFSCTAPSSFMTQAGALHWPLPTLRCSTPTRAPALSSAPGMTPTSPPSCTGRAGVFWKEARGGEPEANPWGVNFSQMFNMTSDSGCSAPGSSGTEAAGVWKAMYSSKG